MAGVCFPKLEAVITQLWNDISSKFGVPVDFNIFKRTPSLKLMPEVDLRP